MPDNKKKKLVGVYLPLYLIRKLKVYAAERVTTISAVVEEALKKFLR